LLICERVTATGFRDQALEADARDGHLFLVYTGDGEGPVDIYVNEPLPATEASSPTPLGDEFLPRTEAS
jgi:hypothetical protein